MWATPWKFVTDDWAIGPIHYCLRFQTSGLFFKGQFGNFFQKLVVRPISIVILTKFFVIFAKNWTTTNFRPIFGHDDN